MLSGPLKIVICLALFLLNFFFFYCLKLPCMKIYKRAFLQIKHPCFTWDVGPLRPSSRRLQSPGPSLQRLWQTSTWIMDILTYMYLQFHEVWCCYEELGYFQCEEKMDLCKFDSAGEYWEGNRQEGQGSPNGENSLQVSDIFISLKRQEETN